MVKFSGREQIVLAVVVFCCLMSGCNVPDKDRVRGDFLKEHPTYEIISIGVGEGDSSAVYFHIQYKKPGDAKIYEDVWQYLQKKDQGWVLAHKETLNINSRK